MKKLGLDIGTKNIVLAERRQGKLKFKREVNGFVDIVKGDGFIKQILTSQGIPFIERDDKFTALGMKAEEIAYHFGKVLRRPMENGVLAIGEEEAMKIMAVIIKSLIWKLDEDAIMYYCVPGSAINANVNVRYHQKVVQAILDSYKTTEGRTVRAFPINEARAIVVSQIPDRTGIGISFGAGMVNISYCLYGMPIYEFSIVGSGDWVDIESARVTGNLEKVEGGTEKPKVLVTKAKEKINLGNGMPDTNLEKAIFINYQILIENVAKAIADGFRHNESKARAERPMPIVCAGGTSMPNGFLDLFKSVLSTQKMPFEIGAIIRSEEPLYAIAEGCLIASELHEEPINA
jgi:actin-like ATPase involved in cell morphogenesis